MRNGLCSRCNLEPKYTSNTYCLKCKLEYITERRITAKKIIDEIKESTPCADCGKRFPAICMDFDHLGNKFKNISRMIQNYSMARIIEEMKKCEIVCSNCHRLRTAARLIAV